ncbi:MAG: hypothetical protein ACRC7C_06420, partial [Beijerinckiaceae bacterium]
MSSRAPDLRSVSIVLADPEAFSMKLMREMARDCGVRQVYEVSDIEELGRTLEIRRPTIAVIDQAFLTAPTAHSFLCHVSELDVEGVIPLLAILGKPSRAVVEEARIKGIRVG